MRRTICLMLVAAMLQLNSVAVAQESLPGDAMATEYFSQETAKLRDACLADIDSLQQFQKQRVRYRQELLEMLGLSPLPGKTDLKATITGQKTGAGFRVERVHFQSKPGLYVTGNLYLPDPAPKKKLPAILYVCGHGGVRKNGLSYGNKVHYQHHGEWFARNGYVCLTIDTLQLGEIEGVHHGTYSHNRWWWLNRGYTPAGVEAWNCVRSLDYLQSRPEVDGERLGVTGRSGGGAYSWWIAAIDERIKAAVPVAGITDLENHVVDGCVEGHCDCMFMVNTFRWDYAKVASLVAPRPLLISNTDRDRIFPLEGVVRTHAKVRRIYHLYGADDKLALHITAGPHKDTQELRVHAFRWFNKHLKGEDGLIEKTAVKFLEPSDLRVFEETENSLPRDELNTSIDESFVAEAGNPQVAPSAKQWNQRRKAVMSWLDSRVFAGWPKQAEILETSLAFSEERKGLRLQAWDFTSQAPFRLRLYVLSKAGLASPSLSVLNVHDEEAHAKWLALMRPGFESVLEGESLPAGDPKSFESTRSMLLNNPWAMAFVAPRGIGRTRWNPAKKKQTQHRRRFYLLGQSLDGMRVYDVRRAMQAIRGIPEYAETPLWLQSQGAAAGITLYASLYEPPVVRIDAHAVPHSHRDGPFLLNVSRFVQMPEIVAMAAERSPIVAYDNNDQAYEYVRRTAESLDWDAKQFRLRKSQ
jgi:dienelactone hydrolase